jgi:hypothetical protein
MFSFPQTDAKAFQKFTATQQDQLMADFTAAVATHERAVTGATHNNRARAWGRWEIYCQSVGCSNFYMDGLSKQEKILMLRAFVMAVRSGRFSGECYETLAEGTVNKKINLKNL